MVGSGNKQEACKAANCTGKNHSSDDNLFYIDSDIARGVFALAYNGKLIAVLAVFEVYKHQSRNGGNNKDIEKIFLSEKIRYPACRGGGVDNAHDA